MALPTLSAATAVPVAVLEEVPADLHETEVFEAIVAAREYVLALEAKKQPQPGPSRGKKKKPFPEQTVRKRKMNVSAYILVIRQTGTSAHVLSSQK